MAESSNLRKSTRKRQSNKRYSIDPFEALNITSSGSEHDVETLEELGNQDEDEDFISDQEAEAADEDNVSLDELSDGLESGLSVARNKSLSRADDDPDLFRWTKPSSGSKSARWKQRKEASKYVHSRGLKELPTKSQAKDEALKLMLGSNHQDWVPFLRSRDQWINEPTLPRRTNNTDGVGGMCHHFSHTEEKRNMEATVGWDWYYSQGGKILFAKQQSCQVLNSDEAFGYLPKPTESSYRVLMGPYGRQRLFSLSFMQSLYLNEAWISPLNPSSDDAENQKPKREGWMLNAGTSITCLDWVPNQDGEVQYLAIATAQTKEILNQEYSKSSPAYTPLPSLSCIQIWAFTARETPDHQSLLDSKKPPQLQLVICTEWGNIKQLKWCQIPRTHRAEDSSKVISLGLLAAIWGDGYVRILDIELEKELEHKTSWSEFFIYDLH